jgi:hypothetical protein
MVSVRAMKSELDVDKAWQEVSSEISSGKSDYMAKQMAALTETQPAIADFILEAMPLFQDEDTVELMYFMVLVLLKTCADAPTLSESVLDSAYQQAEHWGQALGKVNAVLAEKKLRDYRTQVYQEPYLMAFAIEAILDCGDDGLEVCPEDQLLTLILVKAIVDALSAPVATS